MTCKGHHLPEASADKPGVTEAEIEQTESQVSVLVVEDEPLMRRSLCELLRPQGYQVHEAARGLEAKEALSSQEFHIALIDLHLPDFSGQKLIEFVHQKNLPTKLIVVTGEANFSTASHAFKNGVFDFISKPFDVSHLLRTIKEAAEDITLKNEAHVVHKHIESPEEVHKFIVNNSPDFIYMLDKDGNFVFVNQKCEEFLGCKAENLIGKHYSSIIHAADLNIACYTFNERRTGDRSTKGVEMRLQRLDQATKNGADEACIPVELISMGVYKENCVCKDNFIGTYGVVRDLTERKRSEEIIRYHLYHDSLTSLPNRALFNDRLYMALLQAKRDKTKLAVMFLDLDRFKKINDHFGHQAGDEILQTIATSLQQCIRETDTLARVGGDEFLLLTPNLSDSEDAALISRKILDSLKDPIMYRGQEIRITLSIGIAIYPEHGQSKESLIRHADMAMYRTKEKAFNGYYFYSQALKTKYFPDLELENDLYSAIQRNQLKLYYQPQVDIQNEHVVAIEALMRWEHPKYGMISPAYFIPIAEQNGLINDLGQWGLQQACRDTKELEECGLRSLKTSFNVSGQQLANTGFPRETLDTVKQWALQQNQIELEITESSLIHDLANTSAMLKSLAREGITIAIDDFGAGYSSLNYLQNLTINTLKLDRTFIQNACLTPSETTIFTAIHSMAQSLQVDCVAEGVETAAQKDYLQRLGFCSIIQGFFYSPPIPFEQIKTFIARRNRCPSLQDCRH